MIVIQLRHDIEYHTQICARSPAGGSNGALFVCNMNTDYGCHLVSLTQKRHHDEYGNTNQPLPRICCLRLMQSRADAWDNSDLTGV